MKKVFLFAVAAAALVACSNEELSTPDNALVSKEAPVTFSVYTQRGLTRAGEPGTIDNKNIGRLGFGVFAYYTAGEQYDAKATPNFMYNQKVVSTDAEVSASSVWTYEPVKYWPNEFGSDAKSDEVDRVSFFAYAPWTQVDPTSGNVVGDQKKNIISVNKNTATGDPLVKYIVDTDPATSVDLLWGVAAATNGYSAPIQGTVNITEGKPFIDLVKPAKPAEDKLNFNLKHALAKVKITIDYIADDATPTPTANPVNKINADQTRIYVRNFKMNGFALKGALNLNNNEMATAGEPLWKDFDGVKDLSFEDVIFQDGRKDGKEGETNGAQTNETPQGLNPNIIENYCLLAGGTDATEAVYSTTAIDAAQLVSGSNYNTAVDAEGKGTGTAFTYTDQASIPTGATEFFEETTAAQPAQAAKFGPTKTSGVTEVPQLLLGDGAYDPTSTTAADEGYFFVIPRNQADGQSTKVDVTIAYDVETIDPALAGKLSDGETHGISIENVITKEDIFSGVDFKAGYVYDIKIHLGMTSVKIAATVNKWEDAKSYDVELPANQPANNNQGGQGGGQNPDPGQGGGQNP